MKVLGACGLRESFYPLMEKGIHPLLNHVLIQSDRDQQLLFDEMIAICDQCYRVCPFLIRGNNRDDTGYVLQMASLMPPPWKWAMLSTHLEDEKSFVVTV